MLQRVVSLHLKFLMLILAFSTVLVDGYLINSHFKKRFPTPSPSPTITAEQLASHGVVFSDRNGREIAMCSATAIGPHAFIPASHCSENAFYVRIDLSPHQFKLVGSKQDDRDHVIYLIDGPPFENWLRIKLPSEDKLEQTVTIFGVGNGAYPPRPLYGQTFLCDDHSDIDKAQGVVCINMGVIPGDSGAAIFNIKGEIVALVTYQGPKKGTSTSFALGFKEQDYKVAREFSPEKRTSPKNEDLARILQQLLNSSRQKNDLQ